MMNFKRCIKEPTVYLKNDNKESLVVAIYVDDLFVTRTSQKVIDQFKRDTSREFEMSDLGNLTYYLGIEVVQGTYGIRIKQEGYAQGILIDTKMDSCNSAHILVDPGMEISKVEDQPEIDATRYRRTIGFLRYLLHTRPDLAFAVGVLSRYMQSPIEVVGYNDNSYKADIDDGRCTGGHVFYLGSSLITWTS
ncbi:PREDICTED: uncharacterized protein LOC109125481 [Camelina sativa]|uniref:Uncharacterized protein LOC109125481 n=1 Tax=Camelina sativa TaxID=90675 RepID=A0ABM1Q7C5_CAMSA|nr:PREDICTED: uncharacterized protein LOC109125481 [Camelina sativa]